MRTESRSHAATPTSGPTPHGPSSRCAGRNAANRAGARWGEGAVRRGGGDEGHRGGKRLRTDAGARERDDGRGQERREEGVQPFDPPDQRPRVAGPRADAGAGAGDSGDEVAAVAVLLASDEATYITGTEIDIDGGLLAGSAASPG